MPMGSVGPMANDFLLASEAVEVGPILRGPKNGPNILIGGTSIGSCAQQYVVNSV